MTNDLIARLRDDDPATWPPCDEAADALEAQARRIAELEAVNAANQSAIQSNVDVFDEGMKKLIALCDTKDARIAVLEAALKDLIEDHEHLTGRGPDEDNWARGNARAALGEKG